MDNNTTNAQSSKWCWLVISIILFLQFIFGIIEGVIAYRGSIYAIGGFNGTSRLSTGERYNPTMNTWRPITDMFHPRSNFAIEVIIINISFIQYKNLSQVLDDLMFTIGGFNGLTTVSSVECYDDTTDEW